MVIDTLYYHHNNFINGGMKMSQEKVILELDDLNDIDAVFVSLLTIAKHSMLVKFDEIKKRRLQQVWDQTSFRFREEFTWNENILARMEYWGVDAGEDYNTLLELLMIRLIEGDDKDYEEVCEDKNSKEYQDYLNEAEKERKRLLFEVEQEAKGSLREAFNYAKSTNGSPK